MNVGSVVGDARLSDFDAESAGETSPSGWRSMLGSTLVVCMRGEEVVRYPECEGCDIRGGGAGRDGGLDDAYY